MLNASLLKRTIKIWLMPCFFIASFMLGHQLFQKYSHHLAHLFPFAKQMDLIEQILYFTAMGVGEYWLFVRIIEKTANFLKQQLVSEKYQLMMLLIPFISTVLRTITFLNAFNFVAQHLNLPDELLYVFNKLSSISIVCAVSGIALKLIDLAREFLLHHYASALIGKGVERKIYTQTLILKRVAYVLVFILTVGSILLLFDNVRALGTSVLTSAGIIGLILTFTAQRSLGSIFSGLEIALTHPIKIGDKVFVENELGTVEEINFRNVVIKLWNWRRLIVPTSFF